MKRYAISIDLGVIAKDETEAFKIADAVAAHGREWVNERKERGCKECLMNLTDGAKVELDCNISGADEIDEIGETVI